MEKKPDVISKFYHQDKDIVSEPVKKKYKRNTSKLSASSCGRYWKFHQYGTSKYDKLFTRLTNLKNECVLEYGYFKYFKLENNTGTHRYGYLIYRDFMDGEEVVNHLTTFGTLKVEEIKHYELIVDQLKDRYQEDLENASFEFGDLPNIKL